MNNTGNNKIMNILKAVFLTFVGIICLYLVLGQIFMSHEKEIGQKEHEDFSKGWVWLHEDGSRTEIEIPGKCDVERNELMVVENILPDNVTDNQYLCIRSSKQEMKIYVDEELRHEYTTKDTRLFGRVSAVAYVFVELKSEDAGKTIRIELQTDSSYSGVFHEMFMGEKWEIWSHLFKSNGLELCIGLFMLVLGIATIIISIAFKIIYKRAVEMEYLAWGVFLAAIWILANSVFRQIIFPSVSVISDIAFFMVMLLSVPFMLYLDCVQKGRYRKAYIVMVSLNLVDTVVCTTLHVANIVDFSDTIKYMGIVAASSIIVLLCTMVRDIIKGYIKHYKYAALGILSICVAAVIQLILYFKWTNQFSGSIIAISLILVLVISFVNSMGDILKSEREKQQAITSNEAKGKFLANMSHEIRTPINAVLGMDEMILRESDDENIREYAVNIQHAGQTLLAIVNDILDLSKIESGKMEIVPVEYDFSSMLYDVVNMIKIKAENKNLTMNFNVDQVLPYRLFGDEVRVRQVLINILSNGVKYTKKGSVSLDVTGVRDGDYITIKFVVKDTGIGIKQEDIHKLFARFERIEEERNRNIEGTGLGMNITMQLLRLMGSELKVESEYGVGSTFSFELVQKIVDDEPIGNLGERISKQTSQEQYKVTFEAKNAKILVVDDNAINRKVFISLLKQTKVKIDEAESGFECLELVKANHYDIIFLDHMMPDMDGIETLHRMKSMEDNRCVDSPIIALTANAIQGAKEMYLNEGFNDFLSKPINPERLEKMIWELLPKEVKYDSRQAVDTEEMSENAFPDIEGVDWNIAMQYLMDRELVLETARDFYSTMEKERNFILDCYNNLDDDEMLNNYRVKVHGMKSSLALIGISGLSEKARLLEMAAAGGDRKYIHENTMEFLTEWDAYKDRLSVISDNSDKIAVDLTAVKELVLNIRSAMEDMDIDMADDIMKTLKGYEYDADMSDKVNSLGAAVVNLDVDEVMAVTDEILKLI